MSEGKGEEKGEQIDLEQFLAELSKPENIEAMKQIVSSLPSLKKGIAILQQLDQSGALDTLFSLADILAFSKDMLTDEMIDGAGSLISNAIDILSKLNRPEVREMISAILDHSAELSKTMEEMGSIKGLLDLRRPLKDPDVQRGLGIVFALLKVLGKYAGRKE